MRTAARRGLLPSLVLRWGQGLLGYARRGGTGSLRVLRHRRLLSGVLASLALSVASALRAGHGGGREVPLHLQLWSGHQRAAEDVRVPGEWGRWGAGSSPGGGAGPRRKSAVTGASPEGHRAVCIFSFCRSTAIYFYAGRNQTLGNKFPHLRKREGADFSFRAGLKGGMGHSEILKMG